MEFYKNKLCIVTGGAGFIGQNLVRRLLKIGAKVIVLDRKDIIDAFPARDGLNGLSGSAVDLTWQPIWSDHLRWASGSHPDVVFHLAADVGSMAYYQQHPFDVLQNNLAVDANVIGAAIRQRMPVFFYASSPHADHPNRSTYGAAKAIGEKLICSAFDQGYRCTRFAIGRVFGAYGPGQSIDLDRGSFIAAMCHRAARYPEVPFEIRTDGTEMCVFTYIDDVVEGILRATEAAGEDAPVFDIGCYRAYKIREVAEMIADGSGKGMSLACSDAKAASKVQGIGIHPCPPGWSAQGVTLEDGITRTYRHVRKQVADHV